MSKTAARIARLRVLLLTRPAKIIGALLVIYAICGFLLAPWLVRQQFPGLVEQRLGAQGSVAAVRINPFLLTFEATELAIAEKTGAPVFQAGRVFVDFELSSLLRWAWTFREIRIEQPVLNAELDAKGNLNLVRLLAPRTKTAKPAAGPAEPTAMPRLLLQHFVIAGGTFNFTDQTLQPAVRERINPFNFEMHDISTLRDRSGDHALKARLPGGGSLQWEGKLGLSPLDSSGAITLKDAKLATLWQFVQDQLTIAEPAGSYELGLRYRMRYVKGALELQADDLAFRMKDVALTQQKGGAPLGKIASIALEGGRFDLRQRTLVFRDVRVADGSINVVLDQDGKPDWAKLVRETTAGAKPVTVKVEPPAATTAEDKAPWQLSLPQIHIGPLALAMTDGRRVKPLQVTIADTQADFSLAATVGKDFQVTVSNLALKTGAVGIHSGDEKEPLIALSVIELADGAFDLQKKTMRAGLLQLSGGNTRIGRETDGSINILNALAAHREQPSKDSGFSILLDRAEINSHAITVADRSLQPAVAYDLEQLRLVLSKIAWPFKGSSPLELALRVKQGGQLKAAGAVDLLKQTADIRFEATDVALAPLEPALRRDTTLTLASGKAGAAGRLIWNGAGKPATLRYTGSAAIIDLDLKTEGSAERLFSWQRLAAADIHLDTGENRLAIAQINVIRPYSKLVINKDRTTNLAGIMRPRTAPAKSAAADTAAAPSMAISMDRVSVERGELDFADLSLVLPFATNIKALGGSASGLSSAPESRASLKFEGRIEENGLARAEGTFQPFAPKKFTDIVATFRNVALSPLSPYTATFAGRKIASGRLSLDLQYKLDNSQLSGNNTVRLEQFTLGERVESPTAIDLPLDLAIALMTDSDGKIDLSIPVSGNIDHPEFSYGSVIWQTIRTVLTRIVTAPFRALGALFGSDAETLGDIVFDPGSARILPTEYEKIRRVAEGLQKRTQLKLVVQGLYHPETDSRALRIQVVRADLALREGLKLVPDEDPGPVGFDSAKTQRALENMLNERAGGDAAAQFAAAFQKTAGREAGRVNAALALVGRGAGDRELYIAMHQKLVELQPLPATALEDLAKARAAAITNAFTNRLKFDPARLTGKPPAATDEATKSGVPLKLSFEPIK